MKNLKKSIIIILLFSISSISLFHCSSEKKQKQSYKFENVFRLVSGGSNQYLLPVKIGDQVMNLLLDTGSNAILVFADRLLKSNDKVKISDTKISKAYSSTTREGRLAKARVQVGSFIADSMNIMVIDSPDSFHDPSLALKKAEGIIGIRRTDGLNLSLDNSSLDIPLTVLQPPITMFELNLPKDATITSPGTLAFNTMPILQKVDPAFLFQSKTLSLLDPIDKITKSYSDLQVPFRAKSSMGSADDDELDVLLDTGAISKLVLDIKVAEKLGYDSSEKKWLLEDDDIINFNIKGPYNTLAIEPKFKVSEVKVEDYSSLGVEFEAVLGIESWQNYVIGFSYVNYEDGGPDGTIIFLDRDDLEAAQQVAVSEEEDTRLLDLSGLNTGADESNASVSYNAKRIAFQSNRTSGKGSLDIYVYERESKKILSLKSLNTKDNESDPSISSNGEFIVFHSNRSGGEGNFDIYMYNINKQSYVDLPGLNSEYLDRTPAISSDGNFIVFRSERPLSSSDTCYTDNSYCSSYVYMYDISKNELVLEGLTSNNGFIGNAYDPSVSSNGSAILFELNGSYDSNSENINSNPYLYDFDNGEYISLPAGTVTDAEEAAVAISADAHYIAYTSNRSAPALGLFNRDLVVVDIENDIELFMPGLNSSFDEHLAQFDPANKYLVFQSIRPEGEGGKDVYLYNTKGILE